MVAVDATLTARVRRVRRSLRPMLVGLLAVGGLIAFYLGIITLAQDWGHATQQLADDRWFIGTIAAGFGTQVGLLFYMRRLHARAAVGGVAVSTGTSTAAMLACCAHHLADVLPIIGLSGAAIFLNDYKTPLLWLGIAMNAAGIVYLLRQIRRQRWLACHATAAHAAPANQRQAPAPTPAATPMPTNMPACGIEQPYGRGGRT